jgi:cytochrome c-type biogenesis protein CcmH
VTRALRLLGVLLVLGCGAAAATTGAAAGATGSAAAPPRASLPDIEDEVMCTSCRIPLNIAESPQADRQRALIRNLIAAGLTKEQIKRRLVVEYGENVLALPKESGFGIAAYAVPAAVVLLLGGGLALLIPRWRRRGSEAADEAAPTELSDVDEERLDEELVRYER